MTNTFMNKLRKFNRVRGSITVMMTGILMVVIMMTLCLFDYLRVAYAFSKGISQMDVANYSLAEDYDSKLFEETGIRFYNRTDDEMIEEYMDIMEELGAEAECLGTFTEHDVSGYCVYLTMNCDAVACELVGNYVLTHTSAEDSYALETIFAEFEKMEATVNAASDRTQNVIDKVLDEPVWLLLGEKARAGLWQTLQERLSYEYRVPEDSYAKRFSLDMMRWCGDVRMSNERFQPRYINRAFSDELAELVTDVVENWEDGGNFLWFDCLAFYLAPEHNDKMNSILLYSDDFCTDASMKQPGVSGLAGELEYLLYGYAKDEENIAKAAEQIMKLRFYLNLEAITASAQLKAMYPASDYGVPEEEVWVNWAWNEAYYDTMCLLEGGRLPLEKKTFTTNPGQTYDNITVDASKYTEGISYRDYLKWLAYHTSMSGNIVCYETIYARWVDWMEYAYGIDPETYAVNVFLACEQRVELEPVSIIGDFLPDMFEKKSLHNIAY